MNELDSIMKVHMGRDFFTLPPLLQRVHDGSTRLQGFVQVKNGNLLAKIICRIFKFPKQHSNCHLIVDCRHDLDSMGWLRNFDGLIMESSFYLENDDLVEKLGPLAMATKARSKGGTLVYEFLGTKFFGVPMPRLLSPIIVAYEEAREDKYFFQVEVKMPLIGFVLGYGGELEVSKF